MDPLIRQQYEDLFTMYNSPGWKHIHRQFVEMLKNYDSVRGLSTEADLNFRKGQIDVVVYLIAHQDQHERAFAELISQETGAEPEAPTGGKASVIDDFEPEAGPEIE